MATRVGNRPAEIFGYPIGSRSEQAQKDRARYWCPFLNRRCSKTSRLIDFPFGVCSIEHNGQVKIVCPLRFEEQGKIEGISKVLENIALHYFGDLSNIIVFSEVRLPNVGSIDYVLVRHKPMKPQVEEFLPVELQSDSTTGTGELVRSIQEFFDELDVREKTYRFGMNTYDSIKRAITQLMNKGIVYETWTTRCYWVIQEYIYENLIKRYRFKEEGFSPEHSSRFALYDLDPGEGRFSLISTRFISTTVDEVYQAMRNNPGIPNKDRFVQHLNTKLQLKLSVQRG